MTPLDDNLAWWNERAAFHLDTDFYKRFVARLERGETALLPLEQRELAELGSLSGREVLHLQCHVGTDSLSLAQMGAQVTGVDFSEVAVGRARTLAEHLELPAEFLTAAVGELPERLHGRFELVFTTHGVLGWLPDLEIWAQEIAACLKPGGQLYLSELHPLVLTWDEDLSLGPRARYAYLRGERPEGFEEPGSYASKARPTQHNRTWWWPHGLGEICTALAQAGLRLEWLREHEEAFCPFFSQLELCEDGHWRLPSPLRERYPMGFSLLATAGDEADK